MSLKNERLISNLNNCGAVMYGDFTLASGKQSKYYIDIKQAITDPNTLSMIAAQMSDLVKKMQVNKVAGVELGGVPLATLVSAKSHLPLLIVRKEDKRYGTKGRFIGTLNPEDNVVLIEDVTTSGGSVVNAIEVIRNTGATVKYVICVVDREEGAKAKLKTIDVDLYPLVYANDLM